MRMTSPWRQRFAFLVDEGFAGSLVEAAIRFAIGKPEVSTALVGISDMQQLEQAADAVSRGPLPAEALRRLDDDERPKTNDR